MRPRHISSLRGLAVAATLAPFFLSIPARGQGWAYPVYRPPMRRAGTYGPGMSFNQFGARMNYGEAFGNPYGGLGGVGYGFGYGVGPGFGPGGSIIYSSAFNTPGTGPAFQGYYPPWAAYGPINNQNPAIFGPGSPNWGRSRYPAPQPYVAPPRFYATQPRTR